MEFSCRVGTPDGAVLEQVHRAQTADAVRSQLERQGFHVFEVRPLGLLARVSSPALDRSSRKIPLQRFLIFNQEFASLLRAGMPLLHALEILLERLKEPAFRAVLLDVRERVASGEELSQAFSRHEGQFPSLYSATLRAGERSGELEQVLMRYVRYQKLVLNARKRITSSLVYPVVLVCLSLALIAVMVIFVVPRFEDFYSGLEAELPFITKVTLNLSRFLSRYWLYVLAGLALGVVALRHWRSSVAGERWIDRWKMSIPLVGGVLHGFALSEYIRALATLLAGGTPVVSALAVSAGAVTNRHMSLQLEPVVQRVREGGTLYQSLEETGLFEDIAIDMVKVGEATGSLEEMLVNIADFLDESVETRVERILSLIEPAMLIVMGIVVATLLIAIYLPLMTIMTGTNF